MWPGQQPPGGEQNPQNNPYQQPGYQQPNPYQQPGYQQPNPYGQQPPWDAPTVADGAQPPKGGGGGNRTRLVAIVAALAVVVAAGVTGFFVINSKKDGDDKADSKESASASATSEPSSSDSAAGDDNPRSNETEKPTIAGWKVVVNPKYGVAFDVPPDWEVDSPGVFSFFEDKKKGDGSAVIGFSAPSYLQQNWCSTDSDKDGTKETTVLASSGTKGESGATSTEDIARNTSATFVWAGYTDQTDAAKKLVKVGSPKSYTTKSGLQGTVITSYTDGVPKKDKCDSDGKAVTFGFKNSASDFCSWTTYAAKGVKDELSDDTIDKILSTVRLHGDPVDD